MAERFSALLIGVFGAAIIAHGQPSLSGPSEGFLFDSPTKSIRPIVGSIGTAYLGKPIITGVDAAWIAPRKQHAIVVRDNKVGLVAGLLSDQPQTIQLPESARLPEGVVWSADGSIAVLYSVKESWIQTFTNLPGAPATGSTFDLSTLPGILTSVAADERADRIAVGIRGEFGGAYLIANDQPPVLLVPAADPAAITFSEKPGQLYVADRATGNLFVAEESGSVTTVLQQPSSVADFIAIRSGKGSNNIRLLYLANRADKSLRVYDAITYEPISQIGLDTEPSSLAPLGESSYVLSSRRDTNEAFWVLAGQSPAVYFVPVPSEPAEGQR